MSVPNPNSVIYIVNNLFFKDNVRQEGKRHQWMECWFGNMCTAPFLASNTFFDTFNIQFRTLPPKGSPEPELSTFLVGWVQEWRGNNLPGQRGTPHKTGCKVLSWSF